MPAQPQITTSFEGRTRNDKGRKRRGYLPSQVHSMGDAALTILNCQEHTHAVNRNAQENAMRQVEGSDICMSVATFPFTFYSAGVA